MAKRAYPTDLVGLARRRLPTAAVLRHRDPRPGARRHFADDIGFLDIARRAVLPLPFDRSQFASTVAPAAVAYCG
jgi:hypothetical protein